MLSAQRDPPPHPLHDLCTHRCWGLCPRTCVSSPMLWRALRHSADSQVRRGLILAFVMGRGWRQGGRLSSMHFKSHREKLCFNFRQEQRLFHKTYHYHHNKTCILSNVRYLYISLIYFFLPLDTHTHKYTHRFINANLKRTLNNTHVKNLPSFMKKSFR